MAKSKREKEVPVELGFLEEDDETQRYKLRSAFFPSKFGGLPAWLELKDLPTRAEVKCASCDKPAKLLLQVYAPMETDDSFHRTIFIFVCPNKQCCVERGSNRNLIVLRCQLRQENEFYSNEAPDEKDTTLAEVGPGKFGVKTCRLCGIKSTENCSKCGVVYYCGKEHQTLDWSEHKAKCSGDDKGKDQELEGTLFSERF